MAKEVIIEAVQGFPPELATVILGAMPIVELRGALPVALTAYDFSISRAWFWAILGNMLPVYFLLVFFERVSGWLRKRSGWFDRFFEALFTRTRRKLEDKVAKYGAWALALFVAIPLPVTGAWTGSLAAFVFGLPKKKSFLAIFIGLLGSATIVTLLTIGAVEAWLTFTK